MSHARKRELDEVSGISEGSSTTCAICCELLASAEAVRISCAGSHVLHLTCVLEMEAHPLHRGRKHKCPYRCGPFSHYTTDDGHSRRLKGPVDYRKEANARAEQHHQSSGPVSGRNSAHIFFEGVRERTSMRAAVDVQPPSTTVTMPARGAGGESDTTQLDEVEELQMPCDSDLETMLGNGSPPLLGSSRLDAGSVNSSVCGEPSDSFTSVEDSDTDRDVLDAFCSLHAVLGSHGIYSDDGGLDDGAMQYAPTKEGGASSTFDCNESVARPDESDASKQVARPSPSLSASDSCGYTADSDSEEEAPQPTREEVQEAYLRFLDGVPSPILDLYEERVKGFKRLPDGKGSPTELAGVFTHWL